MHHYKMTGRDSKVREQGVGSLLTKIKYYILLPGTVANNVVFLNSFSDFFFEKKKENEYIGSTIQHCS